MLQSASEPEVGSMELGESRSVVAAAVAVDFSTFFSFFYVGPKLLVELWFNLFGLSILLVYNFLYMGLWFVQPVSLLVSGS